MALLRLRRCSKPLTLKNIANFGMNGLSGGPRHCDSNADHLCRSFTGPRRFRGRYSRTRARQGRRNLAGQRSIRMANRGTCGFCGSTGAWPFELKGKLEDKLEGKLKALSGDGTGASPGDRGYRARATASALAKSSALSHPPAFRLSERPSSHSLIDSMSNWPFSLGSTACIP